MPFKLYNTLTKLFAQPGYVRWSKTGKTWNKLSHLLCHLKNYSYEVDKTEVIEYEQVETSRKSLAQLLLENQAKRNKG